MLKEEIAVRIAISDQMAICEQMRYGSIQDNSEGGTSAAGFFLVAHCRQNTLDHIKPVRLKYTLECDMYVHSVYT